MALQVSSSSPRQQQSFWDLQGFVFQQGRPEDKQLAVSTSSAEFAAFFTFNFKCANLVNCVFFFFFYEQLWNNYFIRNSLFSILLVASGCLVLLHHATPGGPAHHVPPELWQHGPGQRRLQGRCISCIAADDSPNQTQCEMENSALVLAEVEGTAPVQKPRPPSPTCKVVRSCWNVTFLMSDGLLRKNQRSNWNQLVCLHFDQWDNMVHLPSSREQAMGRGDAVKWCHDSVEQCSAGELPWQPVILWGRWGDGVLWNLVVMSSCSSDAVQWWATTRFSTSIW